MAHVIIGNFGMREVPLTERQKPVAEWAFGSEYRTLSGYSPRIEGNVLVFKVADYRDVWDRIGQAIEHGKDMGDDAFWRAGENIRRKLDPKYRPA